MDQNNSYVFPQSMTFPELPTPNIPRQNIITHLQERFSERRRVIHIQGDPGSGKTTLLTQFVLNNSKHCVSFFIGVDTWTSSTELFLRDTCLQMHALVGRGNLSSLYDFSEESLQKLFLNYYTQLSQKALREKTQYYFVINGLERVHVGYGLQTILDLIPINPLQGIFLLTSSTKEFMPRHSEELFPIPLFSKPETREFLREFDLEDEIVDLIHSTCRGIPGYLSQIRRELLTGTPVAELTRDLPRNIRGLLDLEWERLSLPDSSLRMLAILTYKERPLTLTELADVLNCSANQLSDQILELSFLTIQSDTERIAFVTDMHRRYVEEKLTEWRGEAISHLISHYNTRPLDEEARSQLPILYAKAERYNELKGLIQPSFLLENIVQQKRISPLRRDVRLLIEKAHEYEDWETLFQYTLISSILRSLATTSINAHELQALLDLHKYDEALNMAYGASLIEDQLELLAMAAKHFSRNDVVMPSQLFHHLGGLVKSLEPNSLQMERSIEIATNLFYVHPQAAMELVEKATGTEKNGKRMDTVLAILSLRLGDEPESADNLRNSIQQQEVADFVRANSSLAAEIGVGNVIAEAKEISDTSARLFLLRSWCNRNQDNPDATKVIDFALDTMTSATNYSPSIRHLRQFAEPLACCCEPETIGDFLKRIDILKQTAIPEPFDELIRLEMLLASLELSFEDDRAIDRFYNAYFLLDDLHENEQERKCFGLTRLYIGARKIVPTDISLIESLRQQLNDAYQKLLGNSAEHWTIARRMIASLAEEDPSLAIEMAGQLNLEVRRDLAYMQVAESCAGTLSPDTSEVIDTCWNKINDPIRREWLLRKILRNLSEQNAFAVEPNTRRYIERARELDDTRARSLCLAYTATMMARAQDAETAEVLARQAHEALQTVDRPWERVQIAFDVVSIMADELPEVAEELFEYARNTRQTQLADDITSALYMDTLRLAIRILPDALKHDNANDMVRQLLRHIESIYSNYAQVELLSTVALQCYLSDRHRLFRQTFEATQLLIENLQDPVAQMFAIVMSAPCFYLENPALLELKLSDLPRQYRDNALSNVVTFLFSKRNADDPVNLATLDTSVDYAGAARICSLIRQIKSDTMCYRYIRILVDKLVKKDRAGSNRETSVLNEAQSLSIANQLRETINENFPDPVNIRHRGYQIAAEANLARLRDASKSRARDKWKQLVHDWEDIADEARSLHNIADRVLVMIEVAELAGLNAKNLNYATELLNEAHQLIYDIPNVIDRGGRLEVLADAWKTLDDTKSARVILEEALKILEGWSWDSARDTVTGRIISTAHSIDPEFAASLTPLIDNPWVESSSELQLIAKRLLKDPAKLSENAVSTDEDVAQSILGETAEQLLETMCSNKGVIQPERTVGDWLHAAADAEFGDVYSVAAWSLENSVAGSRALSTSRHYSQYARLLETAQFILEFNDTVLGTTTALTPSLPSTVTSGLHLFKAGDRDSALEYLHAWLSENAIEYIRICDPWFTPNELDFLKPIKNDLRVDIVTTWKAQERLGISPGDKQIKNLFNAYWSSISNQARSDTIIYVIGTASRGESHLHDRYIITDGGGLEIGTSLNGLGNKDTRMQPQTNEQVDRVEQDVFTPIILGKPLTYDGERLLVYTFKI